MGYQFVTTGWGDACFLLLCSLLLVAEDELHDGAALGKLATAPEDELLASLAEFDEDLELCEDRERFAALAAVPVGTWHGLQAAALHGSPPFAAAAPAPTAFVRYTAFGYDRRVGPTGAVAPGTYFTTIADSHEVPSGLAAVGRYALPVPRPALYRRDLVVPAGTPFLFGSVAPAFGRSGGGVEIELNRGAQALSWSVQMIAQM